MNFYLRGIAMGFKGLFVVLLVGVAVGRSMAAGEDASKGSTVVIDESAPGAILVGSSQVNSNHLVCTFYDLKRNRSGNIIPMDQVELNNILLNYLQSGWKPSKMARYYRSPLKRYATAVMIPPVVAYAVLTAFGEDDTMGVHWLLHYVGQLVHPKGITFRFVGAAEDGIVVRIDDRVVFCDHGFSDDKEMAEKFSKVWKSSDKQSGKYYLGSTAAVVGDWITLIPGVPVQIEIVVAEGSDGVSSAMLLVEEKGVRYPENQQGGPILPPFKVDVMSFDVMDQICLRLPAGEVAVEGGPVFNDGDVVVSNLETAVQGNLKMMDESSGSGLRIWTGDNGSVLEARAEGTSGNIVILKDASGRKIRIPIDRLSKADQRYIALVHKQEYNVSFEVKMQKTQPYLLPNRTVMQYEYIFSATAKQLRSAKETHDLVGELYVFTRELNGNAHILLAREQLPFKSERNAGQSVVVTTKPIRMNDEMYDDKPRDEDVFSYLFLIKDAEGTVISHHGSAEWLSPYLGRLQQQPVGAFLDPFCNRVHPTPPEPTAY
ncbi:hypothetical protein P4C99_03085 [Pontiellaceae bacterium B1224]|nr:hypothetical protein [Pontiellaceae bacterium B1224]